MNSTDKRRIVLRNDMFMIHSRYQMCKSYIKAKETYQLIILEETSNQWRMDFDMET